MFVCCYNGNLLFAVVRFMQQCQEYQTCPRTLRPATRRPEHFRTQWVPLIPSDAVLLCRLDALVVLPGRRHRAACELSGYWSKSDRGYTSYWLWHWLYWWTVALRCTCVYRSVACRVNVSNKSGGGNHHFRDLETTANDVRKAEKT